MYLATTGRRDAPPAPSRGGRRVPGTVLALGAVSLVTDVSSEMVTAVLPLYLVVGLGLSPLQFGLLDGLSTGATALVRILGGATADRGGRHKQVGGVGYALSACSRLGLLLAGGTAGGIAAAITADLLGKGVRTAPRDALITLHSPPEELGRAFGTHRAMDTTGALLGPLAAFALLWATAEAYEAVFAVSFCVGLLGVLLWVLFVPGRRRTPKAPQRPTVSERPTLRGRPTVPQRPTAPGRSDAPAPPSAVPGPRPTAEPAPRARGGVFTALRSPAFRRILLCAALLGATTIGDAFLYLLLQQRLELDATWFPFLPLGAAVVYLLLAVPAGRLADRVGRRRPFLYGHGALLLAYGLLLAPVTDALLLGGVLVLIGTFYAATDGVLMALTGPFLTEGRQAGGLALVQTAQALARLGAAVAFGAVWTASGPRTALVAAVLALAAALCCAARFLPTSGPPAPGPRQTASGPPAPRPRQTASPPAAPTPLRED
ncbi:MFS transporter [Streptomyces sp. NPDC015130]|uniref:MFS transporter n=1 Tax=Streptomyces sp. NPDC015130 TaxID=3364940 RepID=UPI0037012BC6